MFKSAFKFTLTITAMAFGGACLLTPFGLVAAEMTFLTASFGAMFLANR